MSTSLALNPGPQPQPDHRDRIIASLERENAELKGQLSAARAEAESVRHQSDRAVANLRKQLTPLFNALRSVFGEMDAIAPEQDTQQPSAMPDKKRAVWESWKQKLGGKKADFIQALLDHGEMTSAQLRVATRSGTRTVPQVIYQLNQIGLINKNGGKYSLKEL